MNDTVGDGASLTVGTYDNNAATPAGLTNFLDIVGANSVPTNVESSNWSGAVITASSGESFSTVSAAWVVPAVSQVPLTGVTLTDIAEWVGIDGYNSSDVCQAGVLETVQTSGGQTTISISAWVEWYPADAILISASSFQVNSGNTIKVTVETTGAGATSATFILDNETTGQIYDTSLTAPTGTSLQGNSAEFVVETPELINGRTVSQPLLSDFLNSPVVFEDASATYSSGASASLSSAQSIGMWTDDVPGSQGSSVQEAYGSIQVASDTVTATEDDYWGGSASTSDLGPTLTAIVNSPSSGDLNAGKTVTITLDWNEAVTVANGTPTLSLNDGGTATYSSSSGDDLSFSYTVLVGQNTSELTVSSINLNGATITDGSGNDANLSLTGLTQSGPQIDTLTPTVTSIVESPSSGDLNAGKVVSFTVAMSEAVTVANGTPTLTLNDGGTATYSGASGDDMNFSYTVLAGQTTSELVVSSISLNGAIIADNAGNNANLSLTGLTQSGPQIGALVTSVAESPNSGDLNAGNVVSLTVVMSEAVTVANGTPTLSLNDGGTASYSGSSGDDLNFSYTVLAGQNTSELVVSSINLNGATITDGSGNNASLSLTGLTQSGPQIDTIPPTVASMLAATDTGASDVNSGHLVTVTVNLSEAVTVTGTPTLQLNDNEVAVYAGGSGTDALTFAYVVQTGDNTADLQVTGLNLPNGASIVDGAGNALSGSVSGDLGIEVNATAAASVLQEINGLYVALYGVPATGPGVTYWVNQVLAHDSSETLANADSTAPIPLPDAQFLGEQFAITQSTYFQSQYGSLTDAQFVQALYSNLGGNGISNTADLNYWLNQLQAAEATLGDANSGLLARASVVGQFVHDLISIDLYPFGTNAAENAAYFGLSASDYAAAVSDQQSFLDKIAVSQVYAQNATATGSGSILNYTTQSGPAWNAAQAALADVSANPATASTAIVGINNAVAHQDLALI